MKVYFNKINLRVAFKSPAELGDHFPFKDQVLDPTKLSNVVYHIKCKNCSDITLECQREFVQYEWNNI